MAEPCFNAKYFAAALLGNNEEFAKEMATLSNQLNIAKSLGGDKMAKEYERVVNFEIQSIVDARILRGEAGEQAKIALAKQVKNKKGIYEYGCKLLDMIDGIDLKNMDEYAGLLFEPGGPTNSATEAIEELKVGISNYVAGANKLNVEFGLKNGVIETTEDSRKLVGKQWTAIKKKISNLGKKKKTPVTKKEIEDINKEVTAIVSPDATYASIVKDLDASGLEASHLINSYILGRAFLSEDEVTVGEIADVLKDFRNVLPKITVEDIEGYNSLTELLNRVYTNSYDIAHSLKLRRTLKNKILQLMTDPEGRMSGGAIVNADSLIRTLQFCEAGASFSDVLRYNKVGNAVREVLVDEKGISLIKENVSDKSLYTELKKILSTKDIYKKLGTSEAPKHIEAFGQKITGEQLLKIIYNVSWDENLKKALGLYDHISTDILIDYARVKLFGGSNEEAISNLREIINNFTRDYSPDELSTIAFKATSSVPVKPTAGGNVVYINYVTPSDALKDGYETRSAFYDALADVNTLQVTDYEVSVVEPGDLGSITSAEYIIVPNSKYATAREVQALKDRLASANPNIMVVYPKGKESGRYFVGADKKLRYKTSSTAWFNELSGKMGADSFNQADAQTLEGSLEGTIDERLKILNEKGANFFRYYLGLDEGVSKEEVITSLSEATGIPLNWDSMTPENWELANRLAFQHYTVSGGYQKVFRTRADIDALIADVRGWGKERIVNEIKSLGYDVNEDVVTKNMDRIKDSFIDMKLSQDLPTYIWNKGVILGLANKGNSNNITLDTLKRIISGNSQREDLARLFYGDREFSQSELMAMDTYLSDILDSLVSGFADSLTRNGYQFPLSNPSEAILNHLRGKSAYNTYFAQKFLYKNGLPDDENLLKQIFDDNLPQDVFIQSKILDVDGATASIRDSLENGNFIEEIPAKQRMLPREYNSYWAALGGRPVGDKTAKALQNLANEIYTKQGFNKAILVGKKTSSVNNITPNPGLTEEDIIRDILTKYENKVEQLIENKNLTIRKAHDLKQQASYALNVAGEELILRKYGDVMRAADKEGIMGLGYSLKLATNAEELKALKEANEKTMNQFRKAWSETSTRMNKTYTNINEVNKDLMMNGKIFSEVNGRQVVVDVHDELINTIKNIPDGAGQLTNLRTLSEQVLRGLSNKQAYALTKVLQLVKMNIARGNFYTQLMYHLNPQLRNVAGGLDFFRNFTAVEIDGGQYIPEALLKNVTLNYIEAGKKVDDAVDEQIKAGILRRIYDNYVKLGKTMSQEGLEEIVDAELKGTTAVPYRQIYINAYAPYVNLQGIDNKTYNYINEVISSETEEIRNLLKDVAVGEGSDWDRQWENLLSYRVTLDDGSTVSIDDIIKGNTKGWQQKLFGAMGGQEIYKPVTDTEAKDLLKATYAWFNQTSFVSNNEAEIISGLLGNARKLLQKDTNTNQFVEFDYTIGGQNDILRGLLQWNVFSGLEPGADASKIKKWANTFWKGAKAFFGVSSLGQFNQKNWKKIQQYYEIYYAQTLNELKQTKAPNDTLAQTALELARYMKTAEEMLGSKNGALGVALNDPNVNRAFGNIGTLIKDIDGAANVYSLMNKIGNNQILGLFKFAKEGSPAYNKTLVQWGRGAKKGRFQVAATSSSYIEYSTASKEDMKNEFNRIFGTEFTTDQVNMAVQALGGYKLISDKWYDKAINEMNGFMNSLVSPFTRMVISYPLQLLTIAPQFFAYNVKANGIKQELGVENVALARKIRQKYGILEGTYIDLGEGEVWDGIKRILDRDSDEIDKLGLEFDDGIMGLYGKTSGYISNKYTVSQWLSVFDSVRDNANNIVDAAMAQTFKGLAFVKALQKNDYITFMNPQLFEEFMNNPSISREVKDRLLDRINYYSNRLFQDMLGIGFTGLDRVYTTGGVQDFLGAVLSAINFKGAWGTNMFRQTFEKLWSAIKIAKKNGLNVSQTVDDIMAMPEMTTLLDCLWSDAVWTWRMTKFSDNGKVPDDESEISLMDFAGWFADNIELVSQQWQGLVSFGGTRPFTSAVMGGIRGASGEGKTGLERVGDFALYSASSFISSLASNFGRQWKPIAWMSEALLTLEQQGPTAAWNYMKNEWYKLSGGTLRYMIEEGENTYGRNVPLNLDTNGIPSFLVGNQYDESDTSFSYKMRELENGEYLKAMFRGDFWYGATSAISSLVNSSQFLKTVKNIGQGVLTPIDAALNDGYLTFTKKNLSVYDITTIEDDLKASPTFQKFMEGGKVLPPDMDKANDLLDTYMQDNYIGGYKAYQGIQNFIKSGHLNGNKDGGYYYDRDLEEFYQRVEEKNPGELENFMRVFNNYFLGDPESEQARVATYSWATKWLSNFKGDPEYKKYEATFYRGSLNNLYYRLLDEYAREETERRKAMGMDSSLAKVSRQDIKKLHGAISVFNNNFINKYYDAMYDSDMELMQNKMYNWIADELDDGTKKRYFEKQKSIDYSGNETEELILASNIRNQLKEEIFFQEAIDKGDWESALSHAAILTQQLAYGDESGLVTAALAERYFQRIDTSDLPPHLKLTMKAWLIDNNEDALKYNSEFAESHPEVWAEAKSYLNDILHNTNMSVINDINALAMALSEGDASLKNLKTNGYGSAASAGLKVQHKLADLQAALKQSPGTAKSYTQAKTTFVPVPVKGIFPESTKPKTTSQIQYSVPTYTPKTSTLGPKKSSSKQRAVKSTTRKMTKSEEKELDLL